MLTNLLSSNVSIKFKLKGPLLSPTLACATGLNAIGESYSILKNNKADVMVCGGSEVAVHPLVFHSMNKLSTLYSTNKVLPPEKSSRPFDKDRAGFIIGEGSGVLILEDLEHAKKRGAKIYCEVVGYATFGDAFHLTKPTLDGIGGYRAMAECLLEANITPYEVDIINSHATSTEIGDISELNAIRNLFGNSKYKNLKTFENEIKQFKFDSLTEEKNSDYLDLERLRSIFISANKTQIGHLLGAAGSVESIFAILSLNNKELIDNFNTENPIDESFCFRSQHIPASKNLKFRYVLKNSFAFGGVNTSILYKIYE